MIRLVISMRMGMTCYFLPPHVVAQDLSLRAIQSCESFGGVDAGGLCCLLELPVKGVKVCNHSNQQSIMCCLQYYCSAIVVCGTVCSKRTGELGPGNSQRVTRSTTMKMTTTIVTATIAQSGSITQILMASDASPVGLFFAVFSPPPEKEGLFLASPKLALPPNSGNLVYFVQTLKSRLFARLME